jgi:hypothetical protein
VERRQKHGNQFKLPKYVEKFLSIPKENLNNKNIILESVDKRNRKV